MQGLPAFTHKYIYINIAKNLIIQQTREARSARQLIGEQSEPHTYHTAAKNLRHIYIYICDRARENLP